MQKFKLILSFAINTFRQYTFKSGLCPSRYTENEWHVSKNSGLHSVHPNINICHKKSRNFVIS